MRRATVWLLAAAWTVGLVQDEARGEEGLKNDDRYAKLLAGKPLVEGVGFPGVAVLEHPVEEKYRVIGNGLEKAAFSFWYFHDAGPWTLVLAAEYDSVRAPFRTRLRSIYVEGEGSPATSKGVRVGDPEAKVVATYGDTTDAPPEPLDGFADGWTTHYTSPAAETEGRRGEAAKSGIEKDFEACRWYPALRTGFSFRDGKVHRIYVLRAPKAPVVWLRATPDPVPPWSVRTEPAAAVPRTEAGPRGAPTLTVVPSVPALEPAAVDGMTLSVPKGWTRKASTWSSPNGVDSVEARGWDRADPEPAAGWLEQRAFALGGDALRGDQPVGPDELCTLLGVGEIRAHQSIGKTQVGALFPRTYTVLLRRGERGWIVRVTRAALEFSDSPDGLELARQIMRSIRVEPDAK